MERGALTFLYGGRSRGSAGAAAKRLTADCVGHVLRVQPSFSRRKSSNTSFLLASVPKHKLRMSQSPASPIAYQDQDQVSRCEPRDFRFLFTFLIHAKGNQLSFAMIRLRRKNLSLSVVSPNFVNREDDAPTVNGRTFNRAAPRPSPSSINLVFGYHISPSPTLHECA
jgi:hypothetical protein